MGTCTYPKGSKTPHQNVDTPQEIGTDRFVPQTAGGKDATPGHPSGRTSYPPTKKHVTVSTQRHHANMRKPYANGGGNAQVSFAAPKGKRTSFGTEKEVGKDGFVPKTKSDYGTGGV